MVKNGRLDTTAWVVLKFARDCILQPRKQISG
jgi:hypothetical protein